MKIRASIIPPRKFWDQNGWPRRSSVMDRKQTGGQRDVEKGQNAVSCSAGSSRDQKRRFVEEVSKSVSQMFSILLFSTSSYIYHYAISRLLISSSSQKNKRRKFSCPGSGSLHRVLLYTVYRVFCCIFKTALSHLSPLHPRACDYHCIYHEDPLSICG